LSEIEILQKISNPHIVKFKEAFESFNEIIIITEYLYGGELFDRIATEEFEITEQDCCLYLRQLCRGVEYLHKELLVIEIIFIVIFIFIISPHSIKNLTGDNRIIKNLISFLQDFYFYKIFVAKYFTFGFKARKYCLHG